MYFLNKFCCICMNKSDLKHLFDVDNDGVSHYTKLTSSIAEMNFKELNDQRLICGECCVTLNTVYTFRQTCLRSKTNLITYISQLQTFSNVSATLSVRLTDIKHEIALVKQEIKSVNEDNDNTFDKSNPLSEFKTASYEESIQFPASVKVECESEEDSSVHEDDHMIEGSYNNIKVEDVEHQTMMEDECLTEYTKIDIEDPLAMVKEEPMSDSETPQDGRTMETSEEPTEMEETTIETGQNTQKFVFLTVQMKENSTERLYKCPICKKKCFSKENLTKHSRIHSGERPYECTLCKKSFTCERTLSIHMKIHTDEREYECEVCGKGFNSKKGFIDHQKVHSGEKPHECEICHKIFIHKRQLTNHFRIHGVGAYECEKCHENFNHKRELTAHLRMHSERPYECKICRKGFTLKKYLSVHLKIHSDNKPYECEICKKNFVHKSKLSIHLRVHSGERPFECEKCKRCFIRKDKLITHLRKSH